MTAHESNVFWLISNRNIFLKEFGSVYIVCSMMFDVVVHIASHDTGRSSMTKGTKPLRKRQGR